MSAKCQEQICRKVDPRSRPNQPYPDERRYHSAQTGYLAVRRLRREALTCRTWLGSGQTDFVDTPQGIHCILSLCQSGV